MAAMSSASVKSILERWPSREAIHEDVTFQPEGADEDGCEHPVLKGAIHRWFHRDAVPARYWQALLDGAKRRGIDLTAEELALAHDRRKVA